MARASGANSGFVLGFESTYGAGVSGGTYWQIPFVSSAIGGDQALIKNNLLGRGRNPQDPILDVINDSGDIQVPVDVRNIGLWLKLLMGAPVTTQVAAAGRIDFTAQPATNATIAVGGTTWTFVAGSPSGNQVQKGANLAATMTALATALNASADVQTAKATYTATATALTMVFDTVGVTGNAFTMAASADSNGTPFNANLTGGGYKHVFTSAAAALPSAIGEIGFPEVPSYGRNMGLGANSMKIALATSGLLDATVSLIGQKEVTYGASIAGSPTILDTIRFGQFTGQITRNGSLLGSITSGDITYNNNLDAVRVIRPDGALAGLDPGLIEMSGTINARFADTILLDQAQSQLPCALGYGWSTPSGYSLIWDMPRVFLPRPKRTVNGPQGIELPFNWQASIDPTTGYTATATLINDLPASAYI